MNKSRRGNKWIAALIIGTMVAALSTALLARDRGFNQPGAAGNVGDVGPGRDPGLNQPGAAGNVADVDHGRDPGVNQPGAAGNVGGLDHGRDPGLNQPGPGRRMR